MAEETGKNIRSVSLTYTGDHHFQAINQRGGTISIGTGDDDDFSPVELLLAALAGCSAIDVDFITGKRAPFAQFEALAQGEKIRDEQGNRMVNLSVTFEVDFPEGEDGDRARQTLPDAVQKSQDRLCTVGRTVTVGDPVVYRVGEID